MAARTGAGAVIVVDVVKLYFDTGKADLPADAAAKLAPLAARRCPPARCSRARDTAGTRGGTGRACRRTPRRRSSDIEMARQPARNREGCRA